MSDIGGCTSVAASTSALAKSLSTQKALINQLIEGMTPAQSAGDTAQISQQALALLQAEQGQPP